MQRVFWPDWANFLSRWKIKPLAFALAGQAGPLRPLAAQVMALGAPFFRRGRRGDQFSALLDLLEDETELPHFVTYLQEAGE